MKHQLYSYQTSVQAIGGKGLGWVGGGTQGTLRSLGESLWVTGALSPPTHVLSRKGELVSSRSGPKSSQVPWELEAAIVNIVKLPSRRVEEGERDSRKLVGGRHRLTITAAVSSGTLLTPTLWGSEVYSLHRRNSYDPRL